MNALLFLFGFFIASSIVFILGIVATFFGDFLIVEVGMAGIGISTIYMFLANGFEVPSIKDILGDKHDN